MRPATWYAANIAFHLLLLCASLAWLAQAGSLGPQLANALLLAFALVQLGFAAHDATHRQVLRGRRAADALGLFLWNVVCGLSLTWWRDKHMRHHRHPQQRGLDPDLYAVFAFDRAEAAQRRGLLRWVARYQAFAFPFLVATTVGYFQVLSLGFLLRRRPPGWRAELALILARHGLLFGLAFASLGAAGACAFLALHYVAAGIYLGCVFATNHYALPLQDPAAGDRMLEATRNLRTGALGDYLCGGLNFQIEHHLYPSLPRCALRAAAPGARERSLRAGRPYHEAGWGDAMAAVLRHFHDVGRDLRRESRAA